VLNNKTIVESPIILFLGAGASAPLGKPMMAEFVDKVSKSINVSEQKSTLEYLRRFRGDDLEAILGELDTIIDLDYAQRVEGFISSQAFAIERSTSTKLRTRIKHEIIREYRNVDGAKAVEIYKPLFDTVFMNAKKGVWLPIFTTNYDPAIEEFCDREHPQYELCDGFAYNPSDRHLYWDRSVFDNLCGNAARRNLVLFKLHGSADWLLVKSSRRIQRGLAMYDQLDSDAYNNILIYPATRKIATEDPFYTGYEYFERCCEHARLCIAIGYSFRDYDALTRLRGAMSLNDNLRLLLVGPSAEKVLERIPIPKDRKIPWPHRFGEERATVDSLGKYILETLRSGVI
jgi:hypothetical protein